MAVIVRSIKRLRTRLFDKERRAFRKFEDSLHQQTSRTHDRILGWAESRTAHFTEARWAQEARDNDDPIVAQGFRLRRDTLNAFHCKFAGKTKMRVAIHVPPTDVSPGGYSVFKNLLDSLNYIGVPACALEWGQDVEQILEGFSPNVLLTSDHDAYRQQLNWVAIERFKKMRGLEVGLTASLEEYGNTPLESRLRWAEDNGVDFYFSFRSPEYLETRPAYRPFHERGFRILSVEFGANVLQYFPVPGIERDLDYVFLASSNYDKWARYFSYLPEILEEHVGFLDGPGWSHVRQWARQDTHKFLYARARVGINLHIADSIDWPSELNERTYILAACGVPQLVDAPKLLGNRFSEASLYSAASPREYVELFRHILENPDEAVQRATQGQREVFSRHTTFHRAQRLVTDLGFA